MTIFPYCGLRPFDDSDADVRLFFGREREREIIVANLMASRLTVLYGATGVGKSSVLRAGVAHELRSLARRNREQRGRPELAVAVFDSWREDPVAGIERAVGEAVAGALGVPLDPTPGAPSLADRLHDWTELLDGELYLILDQVEEYFLYHGGEREPGSFAGQLPEIVGRPGLRVNVLLALREDALAGLDVFKARIPGLFGNYLRLDHLDRADARRAILGPVEEVNRSLPEEEERFAVEPELVEAVLDEIAAGRVGLGAGRGHGARAPRIETPHLQLVMRRLWEAEQEAGSRSVRLATLRALGGADEIVRAHLGRALSALTPEEQDVAAAVFDHLVTPTGSKIAHAARDLAGYAGLAEAAVVPVLEKLAAERLLRPEAAAGGTGDTRYEIFHDVLADAVLAWRAQHEAQRALQRERADAARRHRRLARLAAAALVALAATSALAVFALTQRSQARAEARVATSRELAASAIAVLRTDPELSLLLALRGARERATPQAEDALRQALIASRVRAILVGARGPVTSAAFSPDGSIVVTASEDGAARIYSVRGGPALHLLRHAGPVTVAAFSTDGRLVLTASRDGTARVWDAATGAPGRVLRVGAPVLAAAFSADSSLVVTADRSRDALVWATTGSGAPLRLVHGSPVTQAAFAPAARLVATAGPAGHVWLWRLGGANEPLVLQAHGAVNGIRFSADGSLVLAWTHQTVRLWSAATGKPAGLLVDRLPGAASKPGAPIQVQSAAFSPDGRQVVTSSVDGAGRVYGVASGQRTALLVGHTNYVTDAAFSSMGTWIVTASSDRSARTWQADGGQPGVLLAGHAEAVNSAAFDASDSRVVTASDDGTARVWDPGILPALGKLGAFAGAATAAVFSPDGTLAAAGGADGTVRVWTVSSGRGALLLRAGAPVAVVAFSPDGGVLLGATRDGLARLWAIPDGRLLRTLAVDGPVVAASFGPGGQAVVLGAADGRVRLYGAADGALRQTVDHGAPLTAAALSPDGSLVLSAGSDGVARLWRAATGALAFTLSGHVGAIVRASFSPSGHALVTAGRDGTARLWSVDSGAQLHVLSGHAAALTDAEFSADGRLLVTASRDHDGRIWSVADGTLVHVLRGHFAVVAGASFSPDGSWVVTAGPGTAGLWPVESGTLLAYLRGHSGALVSAVFDRTGSRILTAGQDGTVRLMACEVCGDGGQLVAAAQARLAASGRTLTPDEGRRYLDP